MTADLDLLIRLRSAEAERDELRTKLAESEARTMRAEDQRQIAEGRGRDVYAQLVAAEAARDEANAALATCSASSTWPPRDVVARLADAADHLLRDHDCDTHGWEEMQRCRDEARAWLASPPPKETAERDEWKTLAAELRVQESHIMGALCDARDVPVDVVEGVGALVRQRDEARAKLAEAEADRDAARDAFVASDKRVGRLEVELRVKAPNCGDNPILRNWRVGCGEPVTDGVYRCTDCATPFHRDCARKHFGSHEAAFRAVAEAASRVAERQERDLWAGDLDELRAALNCLDRAEAAETVLSKTQAERDLLHQMFALEVDVRKAAEARLKELEADLSLGRDTFVDRLYDVLEKHSKDADGKFLAGDAIRVNIVTDLLRLDRAESKALRARVKELEALNQGGAGELASARLENVRLRAVVEVVRVYVDNAGQRNTFPAAYGAIVLALLSLDAAEGTFDDA